MINVIPKKVINNSWHTLNFAIHNMHCCFGLICCIGYCRLRNTNNKAGSGFWIFVQMKVTQPYDLKKYFVL